LRYQVAAETGAYMREARHRVHERSYA
jgi:hypothetical protein